MATNNEILYDENKLSPTKTGTTFSLKVNDTDFATSFR